jgi:SLBB domain-containing protein
MQASSQSPACVAIAVAMLTSASFSLMAQSPMPRQRSDFLTNTGELLRPVGIAGEVHKPGTFPVVDAPTLAQLIEMAGGLTNNAGPTAILIHFADNVPLTPPSRATLMGLIRPGSAVPSNITLTRIALTERGALDRRPRVEPQDILFVPAKNEG